jgi:hypothetical protein
MDYVKKSDNSLVIMQNGKIIESDRMQMYEDPREKKIQGIHNGKPFMYIRKNPKFSLFPKKHVSFRKLPALRKLSYKYRTPTPYPRYIPPFRIEDAKSVKRFSHNSVLGEGVLNDKRFKTRRLIPKKKKNKTKDRK